MQLDLLAPPPSYRVGTAPGHVRHSATSAAGAERASRSFEGQVQRTLHLIRKRGGCTIHEVAVALGVVDGTASARVRALAQRKLIRDSGERRVNAHSGVRAIVWQQVGEAPTQDRSDTLEISHDAKVNRGLSHPPANSTRSLADHV